MSDQIVDAAFQRGLLLLGCGKSSIRIAPPLSVKRTEVDEAMLIFDEAISIAEQESHLLHVA
jgi:4-aminobutyrate aminotransferase